MVRYTMKYAIIENEKIVNIALASPEVAQERGWIECPEGVDIGWTFDDQGQAHPPAPDLEALAAEIRERRDTQLAQTDWTQAADVPQATKDKWAPYRQALRDVPQQPGFPTDISWPVAPDA